MPSCRRRTSLGPRIDDEAGLGPGLRGTRPVVLYDGQCAFCRVCARALRCLDRHDRLVLLNFNRPEADSLLAPLPEAERRTALHVAEANGTVHSAGPALHRALAEALGAGAERLLTKAAVAGVIDAAYSIVAAHRHRLGWIERFGSRRQR